MPLTDNREVDHFIDQQLRTVPLAAGTRIYKGALVEWNTAGYAAPLSGIGLFAGVAYEHADNTTGASGTVTTRVYTLGDFAFPLFATTPADIGRPVYAIADDILTLNPQSATFVGVVAGHARPGEIILRLHTATPAPAGNTKVDHHPLSFTASPHQSGTLFTNLGAGGPVTVNLPGNPPVGTALKFVCLSDQPFRLNPGPTGGIYIRGAKQPDNKYVQISDIGDFIHLVADAGGDWVAVASINGSDADIIIQA